ncbi:hypothetical protein ACFQ3S_04390 [Mucilaginibacter terrae]|uniref:hypothetical protein n=1 Tax=Mucilaginibacter terrae TaxID=1955052 RepID=UPI003631E5F2
MLKNILYVALLFIGHYSFAQETVERNRKLTPQVDEKYQVLKTDYAVMQGTYAAYLKKTLIAAGRYENNKKTGIWTFFNIKGVVCQRYDYSKEHLIYEAPEDSTSGVRYVVDDSLKNEFKFYKPVRIGGRYYGYLKYINLIRLPVDLTNLSNETVGAAMELLVSPGGRLAEFKIRLRNYNNKDPEGGIVLNVNLNLMDEEDKLFIGAKLNDIPVPVRIIIPVYFYKMNQVRL